MNTTQISPGHPPDISREQEMPTDDNRRQQRQRASPRHPKTLTGDGCCLSMSGSVSWHLLVSFYSWRWQGGVWGVSEGIWVLFLEIGSAQMCFGFSAFAVRSHNIILAQPGKAWLFFHLTIVRPQDIKMYLYEVDKNDWVVWFRCFLMPVKKI